MRIMIVDNDRNSCFLITRHLKQLGHEVIPLKHDNFAYSRLKIDPNFDVIFNFSSLNALAFIKRVKHACPHLRVVVGLALQSWSEKHHKAGADYCLVKPITKTGIEAALCHLHDQNIDCRG